MVSHWQSLLLTFVTCVTCIDAGLLLQPSHIARSIRVRVCLCLLGTIVELSLLILVCIHNTISRISFTWKKRCLADTSWIFLFWSWKNHVKVVENHWVGTLCSSQLKTMAVNLSRLTSVVCWINWVSQTSPAQSRTKQQTSSSSKSLCVALEQMGEFAAVDSRHSLGRHDIDAGLCAPDGHQASAHRLRMSGTHRHGADGELARAALATRAEHARGTTAQPTVLWELRVQTHSRHVSCYSSLFLAHRSRFRWLFFPLLSALKYSILYCTFLVHHFIICITVLCCWWVVIPLHSLAFHFSVCCLLNLKWIRDCSEYREWLKSHTP